MANIKNKENILNEKKQEKESMKQALIEHNNNKKNELEERKRITEVRKNKMNLGLKESYEKKIDRVVN